MPRVASASRSAASLPTWSSSLRPGTPSHTLHWSTVDQCCHKKFCHTGEACPWQGTGGRCLRLEQRIANGDLAACHHLGVDAHIDVAEGGPAGGDRVEG